MTYLEPHEQLHPRDWIEIYYCCPSDFMVAVQAWKRGELATGSAKMERREISEWLSRREKPILITDIKTLGVVTR